MSLVVRTLVLLSAVAWAAPGSTARADADDAADRLARATALSARMDWPGAVTLLEALRATAPVPAGVDLQLAVAYRHLGRVDESLAALARAEAAGLPAAQVALHRARIEVRRGQFDAAFELLARAAEAGAFGRMIDLARDPELTALQTDARWVGIRASVDRRERRCLADPAYRKFDFWIGEWDVTGAAAPGAPPASSTIAQVVEGCAISEFYTTVGYSGRSFTFWDAARQRWQQTYVDSTGSLLEFHGNFDGPRLVLLGEIPSAEPAAPPARQRLSFEPLGPHAVRQLWEQSTDNGATWQVVFDGHYQRKGVPRTPPS